MFLDNNDERTHCITNGVLFFVCGKKKQTGNEETLQTQWFRQFQFVLPCRKLQNTLKAIGVVMLPFVFVV